MTGSTATKTSKAKSPMQAQQRTQEPMGRSPVSGSYGDILTLQDAAGNRAVSQSLQAGRNSQLQRKCACGNTAGATGTCVECQQRQPLSLQTKLRISEPGDRFEQEADRIADQVMRMPEPLMQRQVELEGKKEEMVQRKAIGADAQANANASQITPLVQKQAFPEIKEEEEGMVQKTANQIAPLDQKQESSGVPPIVHEALISPGQPLDPETRTFMESRFGHDFSQVQVHTDAKAADSARAIHALAYTTGQNVVFASGRYTPMTTSGRHLLAHELAHVVQQTDEIQSKSVATDNSAFQWVGERKRSIYQENIKQILLKEDKSDKLTPLRSKTWDGLPAEARKPILESFETLDLPYYAHESVDKNFETGAEQYFNELGLEQQIAFYEIYKALQNIGYWGEIAKIKHIYSGNVQGIKAISRSYADLLENLPDDKRFCQDTKSFSRGGIKWRYLVKAGTKGVHIDLSDETIDVHLDSIAPAIGRNPDGHCSYSAIYGLPHVAKDLLGMDKVSLLSENQSKQKAGSPISYQSTPSNLQRKTTDASSPGERLKQLSGNSGEKEIQPESELEREVGSLISSTFFSQSKRLEKYIKPKISGLANLKIKIYPLDPDFEVAYIKKYRKAPDNSQFKLIKGFYDPDTYTIHLRPKPKLGAVLHEYVHRLGEQFPYRFGVYLNEGMTQHFTNILLKEQGFAEYETGYGAEVACAEKLINDFGEGLVAKAYFNNDSHQLYHKLISYLNITGLEYSRLKEEVTEVMIAGKQVEKVGKEICDKLMSAKSRDKLK